MPCPPETIKKEKGYNTGMDKKRVEWWDRNAYPIAAGLVFLVAAGLIGFVPGVMGYFFPGSVPYTQEQSVVNILVSLVFLIPVIVVLFFDYKVWKEKHKLKLIKIEQEDKYRKGHIKFLWKKLFGLLAVLCIYILIGIYFILPYLKQTMIEEQARRTVINGAYLITGIFLIIFFAIKPKQPPETIK